MKVNEASATSDMSRVKEDVEEKGFARTYVHAQIYTHARRYIDITTKPKRSIDTQLPVWLS